MRIAAIDVGSNSVHMIICHVRPDFSFEVIDREKEMIRLGAGVLEGRTIPETGLAVALQTLAKYKRLAESHGVDEIVAAATSAVREARNGSDFIAAVRERVGIRVRIISGTEEARLIHMAAAYAVGVRARTAVVIDIGGGSTEITLGTAARMQMGRSFRLGAIRLTERFAKSDPLTRHDERRLVRHIRRETGPFLKQIVKRGFDRVIGTSGTILALGMVAARTRRAPSDVRNLRVSARNLHRLRKTLASQSLEARLALPGLDPRRADLAVAGVVLLDTLLHDLDTEDMTLCDFALREGLLLDYIQKNQAHIRKVDRYPDVRRRSVIELGERCGYFAAHAQHVARLALSVFDLTRTLHRLGDREREWLEYGALLHDIGVHISYESHHKHSYYLIKHGDLRGFDPTEIEVIALVARYHRQSAPKKSHGEFGALSRTDRRVVRVLGAIVRLAEGLDRSHARPVTKLSGDPGTQGLVIHLHTSGDAELELWAAHRHATELAGLLGVDIDFEIVASSVQDGAPKDAPPDVGHPLHSAPVPGTIVRRRRDRRVGKDHAAQPGRQVARRPRTSRVRD